MRPEGTINSSSRDAPATRKRFDCDSDDAENDDTINSSARDMPGQSCSYIPPGPHYDEFYRLATFSKFPTQTPKKASDLAAAGMYYTGFKDRVKCFSCGLSVENWVLGDDRMDKRWHKSDHAMFNGNNYMKTKISGRAAGGKKDNYAELESGDIVSDKHHEYLRSTNLKSEADRRILRKLHSSNILMSESEREAAEEAHRAWLASYQLPTGAFREHPDPSPEEQRHLKEYNPCRAPVNPHMRTLQARIESFERNWPNRIKATPNHIAKAGFYFLGESDKTKCYYCNGGLQNWKENDEPWTEHAKWFPGCKYVLQQKGSDFVRRIADQHPNLNRPYIRNPASYDIPPDVQHRSSSPRSNSNINIADLVSMGFSKEKLEQAIEKKSAQGGYSTTEDLIEDLLHECSNHNGSGMKRTAVATKRRCEDYEVKCYYSNGGLQNVNENDEPVAKYARWCSEKMSRVIFNMKRCMRRACKVNFKQCQ